MGADDVLFHDLSLVIHVDDVARRRRTLEHRRKPEEERKVERCVDAHHVTRDRNVAPDVLRDLPLVVVDLAVGEEILLAYGEREFSDSVTETQGELPIQVFQGVDSKSVDIVGSDKVLESADQDVAQLVARGEQLFQRSEVPDGL